MANSVDQDFKPFGQYAHATIDTEAGLADGGTTSVDLSCHLATVLALAVVSDEGYDVDVEWYASEDFTTQLGATQSIASGVAGNTGTEASVDVASPYARVIITDTSVDGGNSADATGTVHMS